MSPEEQTVSATVEVVFELSKRSLRLRLLIDRQR